MQSAGQWHHLVAGSAGGLTSTLVLHPMDLLKIRFAVNEGNAKVRPQYSGYWQAAKLIVRSQGIRALYQGVVPNVVGNMAAWGLYLELYSRLKKSAGSEEKREVSIFNRFSGGVLAGGVTLALTNPIWVAKTRMCLQYENQKSKYSGFIDTLCKTYKNEGIRGWYKGFLPGLLGTTHGAIQIMVYEELKLLYCNYYQLPVTSKLDTSRYLAFSAISKMIAAFSTYPYQVVRSRLQDQHVVYKGAIDVMNRTFKSEGFFGFYKGLLPTLLRVTPATCITFLVYENVIYFLST